MLYFFVSFFETFWPARKRSKILKKTNASLTGLQAGKQYLKNKKISINFKNRELWKT